MAAKKDIQMKNKKASFNYEFLDTYEAGMSLHGTEIKSIRAGEVSFGDSYCILHEGEVILKALHIAEYSHGNLNNHHPTRDRKLLLNRREIGKIESKLKDQGITLVPTKVYINDKGWAKVEIALAKGKKTYDKRDSLKDKDTKRQLDRAKNRF